MINEFVEKFKSIYGAGGDIRAYFAPGRVNLIGEHTDYNGGFVFPCALTIGSYVVARKRSDRVLNFYSENFSNMGLISSSLDDLIYNKELGWTNYPKGIIWSFNEKGMEISTGFDMFIVGNIPNGSGLSSSASVEVVTGIMLKDMFNFDINMCEIALIGQFAENKFNGINCGIMDQFAIAMGQKDKAVFLNTAVLDYEYIPIKLANAKLVISCSNKKRVLAESKYNERRSECEEAVRDIRVVKKDLNYLGELTEEEFEYLKINIKREICVKRAKHAVYENQRTIKAVTALKNNDIELFGKLMNASHISLRDDYEVTGIELDTLVESAWKQEGVIGSRMTGAGFGGCTVSIVRDEMIDTFIEKVAIDYKEKIGYEADFYVVEIGEGARVLQDFV